MRVQTVGASGLRVSRLGLGTSTWTTVDGAQPVFERFLNAGGTLVDINPDTEPMLGALLPHVDRGQLVISAGAGVNPSLPLGRRVDCSRRSLMASLDQTLKTLGTDYVDLWSVGFWDTRTPASEVADTLDWAVRTGRVRYAGVRSYTAWQLAVAAAKAEIPLVAAQTEYSLLVRRAEEELIPAARHLGVGVFAGAPLAQGVLTGKYRTGIPQDSRGASPHRDAEVQGYLDARASIIVEALVTAAEGLGTTPAAVATAWTREKVSAVIVGARTPEQWDEIYASESLTVPRAIRAALDDISL
ncbi:MAG: aldo/keto reductase [Corynebacterium sp.]|nr:aldo/keto reductase [Corynebacterium sp.]